MKKWPVRAAVLALLLGSVALVGPAHPASAQIPPVPEIPDIADLGLNDLVDELLGVGDLVGSLAPTVEFTVDVDVEASSQGGSVEITGTYTCDKTIALDAVLPQLTSQKITVDVAQALDEFEVTTATGHIEGHDVTCDGTEHDYAILALVDRGSSPLFSGSAEVVVRMTACDLLGCTIASAAPTIEIGGSTGDEFEEEFSTVADADDACIDDGNDSEDCDRAFFEGDDYIAADEAYDSCIAVFDSEACDRYFA